MSENVIKLGVMERARLVPLAPRDKTEAEAFVDKIEALRAAAADDNHGVVAPTHVMVKGGEVVGYLSLGAMPTVHLWFDSKQAHASDSLKMMEMGELILQERGVRQYAIACAEESPFTAQMERLGYRKLGATVLWVKELTR